MPTISQNLQRLQTAKSNISTAIETMGGIVTSGDGFEDFSSDILTIPTITSSDNGKVVQNGVLVSQTTRNVTANGTYDTTTNNSTVVNVQASSDVNTGTAEYISNSNYYTRGTTTGVGLFSGSILIIDQNVYYARPSGVYGTYDFTGTLFTLSGITLPKNKTANIVDCTRSNDHDTFTLVFDYTNNTVQVKYNYTLTARGNANELGITVRVYVYWT